ncbi:hypothetical protein B0T14DRAFT_519180 [Immersiella caudata]|uniref:CENP-V/GFA domain-containing protein n=1 Tax=Immersiella caudata TaxID=314043 RepID=A0AA39WQ05_9PEZI|nr:hypothetical protein B0T14DRAFT_519180 [Immersiella caudata]
MRSQRSYHCQPRSIRSSAPQPSPGAATKTMSKPPIQLTLTAQCLCKAHTFSANLSDTDLPLESSCCHCTSCRHSSGALFTCDVRWPGDPADIHASSLKWYHFSAGTNILFCNECGKAVFYEQKIQGDLMGEIDEEDQSVQPRGQGQERHDTEKKNDGGEETRKREDRDEDESTMEVSVRGKGGEGEGQKGGDGNVNQGREDIDEGKDVATKRNIKTRGKAYGVFTNTIHFTASDGNIPMRRDQVVQITEHIFVGDTLDGGLTPFLSGPNVRVWLGRREQSQEIVFPRLWPSPAPNSSSPPDDMPIRCHCKGVDFVFDAREALALDKNEDGSIEARRMEGILDGWESRVLDVMPWVVIPLKHIGLGVEGEGLADFPGTTPTLRITVDQLSPKIGTLKYYVTSSRTLRFFCGGCSAVVFLAEEENAEAVKVAAGLLGSPDGAMARGIVSWGSELGAR